MERTPYQIKSRDELPRLLDHLGYKVGVEVGVKEGNNAKHILDNSNIDLLYCVDIWTDEKDYTEAKQKLNTKRAVLIKEKSTEATFGFTNNLDFVYIDADHSYNAVKADYEAWYPKIRVGGMISGHDYGLNGDCEGVKQFIDEMISKGEVYNFTTDDFFEGRPYQTWYKIKK